MYGPQCQSRFPSVIIILTSIAAVTWLDVGYTDPWHVLFTVGGFPDGHCLCARSTPLLAPPSVRAHAPRPLRALDAATRSIARYNSTFYATPRSISAMGMQIPLTIRGRGHIERGRDDENGRELWLDREEEEDAIPGAMWDDVVVALVVRHFESRFRRRLLSFAGAYLFDLLPSKAGALGHSYWTSATAPSFLSPVMSCPGRLFSARRRLYSPASFAPAVGRSWWSSTADDSGLPFCVVAPIRSLLPGPVPLESRLR
ncbi:hypothetical protein C8R44DRAFT_977396 [Mycena epipterygia]|nr:hypothetical protein C8R44DRAFT_977396 [Mycena epipterygia]